MDIPYIPDYNSIRFSGCSEKYANMYGVKRMYARGVAYDLTVITITSLFGFVWKIDKSYFTNYPITHSFQHLSVESDMESGIFDMDHESFLSLN